MNPIVVVYYSRTGKTRHVATELAKLLGADLEEIVEEKDRSGVLGYLGGGRDAMKKTASKLTSHHDLAGRKLLVMGMPVWAFAPPPAVRGYLEAVDLAGVKLAGFATMDGSGGERTLDALAGLVPGGLAGRLVLKKPTAGDPQLAADLAAWVAKLREVAQAL